MIYCKKCGAELPDDAKFCVKCGSELEKKDGGSNYWKGVIGIILLISGILTLGGIDYDFTSLGVVVGYAVGTLIKVAIPVGIIALIIKKIKKK